MKTEKLVDKIILQENPSPNEKGKKEKEKKKNTYT